MRKTLRALLALLGGFVVSLPIFAQSIPAGYVQTTATVSALANGQYGAAWTNLSSSPQLGLLGCVSTFQQTVNGNFSATGQFAVLLADTAQICPSPSTWTFTFTFSCSAGSTPSAFQIQVPVTGGGSTEDISAQINAALPAKACSGGGGGAAPAAPAFAVQFANSGVTAFQADSNITITPSTHTLTSINLISQSLLSGGATFGDVLHQNTFVPALNSWAVLEADHTVSNASAHFEEDSGLFQSISNSTTVNPVALRSHTFMNTNHHGWSTAFSISNNTGLTNSLMTTVEGDCDEAAGDTTATCAVFAAGSGTLNSGGGSNGPNDAFTAFVNAGSPWGIGYNCAPGSCQYIFSAYPTIVGRNQPSAIGRYWAYNSSSTLIATDTYLDAAGNLQIRPTVSGANTTMQGNFNVTTGNCYQINGTCISAATGLSNGVIGTGLVVLQTQPFIADPTLTAVAGNAVSINGNANVFSLGTATSGGNFNSFAHYFETSIWNGSAGINCSLGWVNNAGTGTNATSLLTFSQSGCPGTYGLDLSSVPQVKLPTTYVVGANTLTQPSSAGTLALTSQIAVSGSGTYTTATSDAFTVTGATASSHCAFSPTNATAAASTVVGYVSAVSSNSVTITHVATTANGGTVNIVCTPN